MNQPQNQNNEYRVHIETSETYEFIITAKDEEEAEDLANEEFSNGNTGKTIHDNTTTTVIEKIKPLNNLEKIKKALKNQ